MSAVAPILDGLLATADPRTREIVERRRRAVTPVRRGWLLRRMLLVADVGGLSLAFVVSAVAFGGTGGAGAVGDRLEAVIFFATLPAWIVVAKLHGLYERDAERAEHTTVDDAVGVFHLVTVVAWVFFLATHATRVAHPNLAKLAMFWVLSFLLVTTGRACARGVCRQSIAYLQNAIIVGAGDVGQLVARKVLQHPEYGINIVGFVDADPKEQRRDLAHLTMLGTPDQLPELIELFDVERVVIAFSREPEEHVVALARRLRELNVQIDLVPRLFELVGPRVEMHTVEGLPLVGLPPVRLSPSSRLIKRALDIGGASLGLLLTAPLFAFIAWRIKRDSPGPILFRQTRLGLNQREFTALKFRTMKVDTDVEAHRAYIKRTMTEDAEVEANGMFKLERSDSVTPFGRFLRRTSLDELPQLLNVLRGDMSLVGPRPCIPYETESFAPYHFERFLVPAGVTGLWQVTARASSTFREALDMDVSYARGWSLGLDVRLLFRTPFQVLRQRRSTA